jgi:hypothetical protein
VRISARKRSAVRPVRNASPSTGTATLSCRLSAAIPCGSISDSRLDFGLVPWKPAAITEKRQQDRKTKPVRAMFIHHQGMIVWRQCPLIIRANDWLYHALKSWSSLTQAR